MCATVLVPKITIGLDLGDRRSHLCVLDAGGAVLEEGTVATTLADLEAAFARRAPGRVVLEAGTHSPWVARALAGWGHEVIVANPSATYGARRRRKRNDRLDAAFLARQGRADPALLSPIQHRRPEAQAHLAVLRARDQLVRSRTRLINHVRGAVKAVGGRVRPCSAEAFATRASAELPPPVADALAPLVATIGELTARIRSYDQQVAQLAAGYPETTPLQRVPGVGPLTALGYVLLVDDPARFTIRRDVGAYFGLVPRLDSSSSAEPQLRITKAGDELGRRLLVSAAHYILGPFGPPCDLRRAGEALMQRGGRNAKKRAVIAVARKLAVLLHRLWVSPQPYDPDWQQRRRGA
jgi:transposase